MKASPWLAPWRPAVGIAPRLSDAELVTLAVMSALRAGLSLYQVVRELQTLLATWTGACPTCNRDIPTRAPT